VKLVCVHGSPCPLESETCRLPVPVRCGVQTGAQPGIEAGGDHAQDLWASVQGDPVFMRRANGWLTVAWIGMIPVSIVTGWIHSVAYISALSLWALVSGHWSAWPAARVEVEQQREHDELEQNPPEQRIVHAIVEGTTLE